MTKRLDMPPVYLLDSGLLMLLLHLGLAGPELAPWPWRWLGLLPIIGLHWPLVGQVPVPRFTSPWRPSRWDGQPGPD